MSAAQEFFAAYLTAFPPLSVYTPAVPPAMMASPQDEHGWFTWQLLPGTLQQADYDQLAQEYTIKLPNSFIDWHRAYYFLDGDCSLVRLPKSNPNQPLLELRKTLDWVVANRLCKQQLYPFAEEGNDAGPLVFDGREAMPNNEFPVRMYDHEYGGILDGLSPVIFSSFRKLLECMTHFLREIRTRPSFEVIPEFLHLDPTGAGNTGAAYWLGWAAMEQENSEEFEE